MAKITLRQLESKGACFEQVALFKDIFGRGTEVTLILCLKHASQFDWDWAALGFLSLSNIVAYRRAVAPARAAYQRAIDPARAAYQRAIDPTTYDGYQRTMAVYLHYRRATAQARADYQRAKAKAFYEAFIGETNG